MTLQDWIVAYGGPIKVSEKLGISQSAVYLWIKRRRYPKVDHMREIIRLSRGKLSYEAIIESTTNPKRLKKHGNGH